MSFPLEQINQLARHLCKFYINEFLRSLSEIDTSYR